MNYQKLLLNRHNNILTLLDLQISSYYKSKNVRIDLPNRLNSPEACKFLQDTKQRPDILIHEADHVAIAELTCCLPKNMKYWQKIKQKKYYSLAKSIANSGYITSLWTLEISSEGHTSSNFVPFLNEILEIPILEAINITKICAEETKNCVF